MANKKSVENEEVIHKTEAELKVEILEQVKKQVDFEVNEAVRKAEKKLLNYKNRIILKRDLAIVILLSIILILCHVMYSNGYFDKFFADGSKPEEKEVINNTQKEETSKEDAQKELIEEYSYLLDNITIDQNSKYIEEFYTDSISESFKNSLAASKLEEDKFIMEEGSYIINEADLENKFYHLFTKDSYVPASFYFGGVNFKYIKSAKIYIGENKPILEKNNIVRVITNVEMQDEKLEITTVEALIKDSKIYNIITEKYVTKYKTENDISKNSKKLNKIKYHFISEDDEYHIAEIEALS